MKMMKFWLAMVLMVSVGGQVPLPATEKTLVALPFTPELVNELSEEARANNPAIGAALARAEAARAHVSSIRRWDDPMLRLGGMGARRMMRAEDGDLIYGVEQRLPLFGRPGLAREAAQAEFKTEEADLDYQYQLLRLEIARGLLQAALAERTIELTQQDLVWLDNTIESIEQLYRAGQTTQTDLLVAMNERAARFNQLRTEMNMLSHDQLALNRLLNRGLYTPWPRIELPELAEPIAYSDELARTALLFEPRLVLFRRQSDQAAAIVNLTRRQRFPEVNAGLEGRNYSGDGSFRQGMLMFSFSVPWVNAQKYRQDIRREELRWQATQLDLEDYELAVREEVHDLILQIDAARREAVLYREEIIPRSRLALETSTAGWQAGREIFLNLLAVQRSLLEAELNYARAVATQYQLMSELVLCCGLADLEALRMIGALPERSSPPLEP
jgi:outer membrane protein, heavy metal efflux system